MFIIRKYKPSLLFFIWPINCFLFITIRTVFGTAPIYWSDASFLFLVSVFPYKYYVSKWIKFLPPWHIYLILVSLIFGCFSAVIFFGPAPEIFYILFHKGICWLAFPLGVLIFHPYTKLVYKKNLLWGMITVASCFLLWALAESGSPSRALALNGIFFKDIGKSSYALIENSSEMFAGRPNGPFFSGTTFGGACTIIAYICWYLATVFEKNRKKLLFAAAAAIIAMLFTVSRLDIIAVILSLIVFIIFGRTKAKTNAVGLATVVIIGVIALSNTYVVSTIFSRFERWSGGATQDQSVNARSSAGPKRLISFVKNHPYIILTGAGMEVDKLAQRRVNVEGFDAGFLSNGFLLFLYYTGIIGFIVYTFFWLWMIFKSLVALNVFKAQSISIIIGLIFIIFSDNYSALDESIIKGLFFTAGLIIGSNYFEKMKQYDYHINSY